MRSDQGSTPESRGGFGFYRIHILQSLPKGETPTGLLLMKFLESLPGTDGHLTYGEVETGDELLEELRRIRDNLKITGQIPLLHIEAHGNPDGLDLASGEFLSWPLLEEVLT